MDKIIEQLAANGLLGLLLALMFYAYAKKDNQITEIQNKRVEDVKSMNEKWATFAKDIGVILDNILFIIKGGKKNE